MLIVKDIADRAGRLSLEADQTSQDGNSRFTINLLSSDLPISFLSQDTNRKASMALVSGSRPDVADGQTVIIVPMMLISSAISNGKTINYYRQLHEEPKEQLSSPTPRISATCRIAVDNDGDTAAIEDPHLVITLSVETVDMVRETMGDQSVDVLGYTPREHVERNENANGGLDLRPGDSKSDLAMHEREENSKQIIPGVDA